ncbi:MAG: OmpA family protein, partial [Bacteroidales bacterium]
SNETINVRTNSYGEVLLPLDHKSIGDSLRYQLNLSKEGYVSKKVTHKSILTIGENLIKAVIGKIEMGVDLAKVIEINPIFFDFDKYNIRQDAAVDLDKIVKIMNEYPNMVIECGSHTDCRGSVAYNNVLSDNRAKSSVEYIKKRIVNTERVSGKGYGESKHVNRCKCEDSYVVTCTEDEHQMNRRTEFRVVGFLEGKDTISNIAKNVKVIYNFPKLSRSYTTPQYITFESNETNNEEANLNKEEVIYRIQLCAITTKLPFDNPLFRGLENLSVYKNKGLYKYTWGATNSLGEAEVLKKQMQKKGFNDAFIVPFYKNKRIPMDEALQMGSK